jgi:hypothetical protein
MDLEGNSVQDGFGTVVLSEFLNVEDDHPLSAAEKPAILRVLWSAAACRRFLVLILGPVPFLGQSMRSNREL